MRGVGARALRASERGAEGRGGEGSRARSARACLVEGVAREAQQLHAAGGADRPALAAGGIEEGLEAEEGHLRVGLGAP